MNPPGWSQPAENIIDYRTVARNGSTDPHRAIHQPAVMQPARAENAEPGYASQGVPTGNPVSGFVQYIPPNQLEQPYSMVNNTPGNTLESIESDDSADQQEELDQRSPRSSKSQPQQANKRDQLHQQQIQQHQQQQQQQSVQQLHQHQQRLQQHQPNVTGARQVPRSAECSDTESFPMDETNVPPAVMAGSEPEAIQDYAVANDLEEHAYRLIYSSRKAVRRLREPRAMPGNYAPGVASAVVADMREVLRVREAGMAEHVKLVLTQELMPLQQQMNRMQADMAEMKRDIQTLHTGSQSLASRLQILERECQNMTTSLSTQQNHLMALSMRVFEGSGLPRPPLPPMVNFYHPAPPFSQHLAQQGYAHQQQRHQQPPPPPGASYSAHHQPLPQLEIHQSPAAPQQQPHVQYVTRPASQMRQATPLHRLTPQHPQQQSVSVGVNAATSVPVITSRATSTATSAGMQLQREDIHQNDQIVYVETVENIPRENGPCIIYLDECSEGAPASPQLVDMERQEVELRRELQDALAVRMQQQSHIAALQQTLHNINHKLNSTSGVRARMPPNPRATMEAANQRDQQQQQQHHQQQQQGEEVVTNNIGGMGPVTDL